MITRSWGEGDDVWEEVTDSGKIMLALVGYGRESGFYSERDERLSTKG